MEDVNFTYNGMLLLKFENNYMPRFLDVYEPYACSAWRGQDKSMRIMMRRCPVDVMTELSASQKEVSALT